MVIIVHDTVAKEKCSYIIPGVDPQKKRNGEFSVPCQLKMSYVLTPLDKASFAEENNIKIIKLG